MALEVTEQIVMRKAGWLPGDTGWPELDALRDRHVAMVEAREEAAAAHTEITARHNAEDEERQHRILEAARAGKRPKVAKPDEAKRAAELTEAKEALDAANQALEETYREILGELRELAPEVAGRLSNAHAEAEEVRRKAHEAMQAAEREVLGIQKLSGWFDRTVNKSATWAFAYEELGEPELTPEPDWANILAHGGVIANA